MVTKQLRTNAARKTIEKRGEYFLAEFLLIKQLVCWFKTRNAIIADEKRFDNPKFSSAHRKPECYRNVGPTCA